MREKLQENYQKIISYVCVAVAVVSVLVAGILAIQRVQNAELKEYQVHGQYQTVLQPGYINEPECYVHEFVCVSDNMQALLVQGQVWEASTGIVWYNISDAAGNTVSEYVLWVPNTYKAGYEGIWIDVSEFGLKRGEQYTLTINVSGAYAMLITYEDFKITVAQVFEYNYAPLYTTGILILMGLSFAWLFYVYKRGYSEKLYIITTLVLGLLLIIAMPPANRDDEYRHFLRAYMKAEGIEAQQVMPTGAESGLIGDSADGEYMIDVPAEINELRLMGYRDNFNGFEYRTELNQYLCIDKLITLLQSAPSDEMSRVSVAGVIFKDGSSYWPQIIAMKAADLLGARDFILYYAARLGQLLVCLIMEVIAMRIAPRMKEMIWLLAFIPNAFLLKISCNPDGLMTAEILLLAAIVVWMKEEGIDFLSKKGMIGAVAYLLLTYNVMKMKVPYILISIGLLIYLNKANVQKAWEWIAKNKKKATMIGCSAGVLGIVGVAALKNEILAAVYTLLPQTHITYIINHPGEIFKLFIEKWGFMCVNLLSGMNGEFFIPYAIFVIAILAMMKKQLPAKKRIWFAILFGILIMVIVLAGYSLSPADHGSIEEIGYRYLLPFLVVGTLALPSGTEKTEKIARRLMPFAIFVTMTTTMITWIVGWSV